MEGVYNRESKMSTTIYDSRGIDRELANAEGQPVIVHLGGVINVLVRGKLSKHEGKYRVVSGPHGWSYVHFLLDYCACVHKGEHSGMLNIHLRRYESPSEEVDHGATETASP